MTTAAPPRPPTQAERLRMIAERQERSVIWRVIHLLGSLKLALILLATISIAIAVATFFESSYNAKIAAATVYKNPLFLFWLGVLCVNLFAVTLTRWPWQRKHTGFIVTHYGIILLLVGAMIGAKAGFEGNVTLHTDRPPVNYVTTSRSIIQFQNPRDGDSYIFPFDAETAQPSDEKPNRIRLADSGYALVVDGFSPNLVESEQITVSNESGALPGVELRLRSAMAGQDLPMALILRPDGGQERDLFGMAKIALLPELPQRAAKMVNETRVIFARYAPVITAPDGSTGVQVALSADGESIEIGDPNGASATYQRSDTVGKSIAVGAASVVIEQYWPDFTMVDGQPASASTEPRNPALLARISGPAQSDQASASGLVLELAPSASKDSLLWQSARNGITTLSGEVAPGESFTPGWADWSIEVLKFEPAASLAENAVPGDPTVEGVPGFRGRLVDQNGTEGPAIWIRSGEISTLTHPNTTVRLGYGLELSPLPFSISLKSFEVPRFEGTETPENFISTVEFKDNKTGETRSGVAKMNHPASWPGDLWANLSGINYKFSQAEWNPKDLGETTLQVLYDPGWLLKWVGSLAICVGIFIQFYLRPKRPASNT